jgi:chemotaxis receptor (MCP) glutamine deamidase CheD
VHCTHRGLADITLHQPVDGATVYKDFTKSVKAAGGSERLRRAKRYRVIPRAVQAETQELFDCNINELYEDTGGKEGGRSGLALD